MNLPAKYAWLVLEPGPQIVKAGMALLGTKEIVGKQHNPIILYWAKELGISDIVKDDEQAWCGLAMGKMALEAGKHIPMKSWDILRALKWKEFGTPVPIEDAMLGDVLIFQRSGGGHVGVYIAQSDKTFHVMGGNQGNAFSIVEIDKSRCVAVRRPIYKVQPANVRKIFMDASGKVSSNEA